MTSSMCPRIVVGVDGSAESLAAVRLAAGEAGLRRAPLRVVHARGGEAGLDAAAVVARARRVALDVDAGIEVAVAVEPGTAEAVLFAEAEDASVVVVGARGRGAVSPLLLGSVALDLVTRVRRPVLLARGGRPVAEAPVVVGVSGAPTGRDAVGFGFREARARGVALHAVHAFAHPFTRDEERIAQRDHDRAHRLLTGWVAEWRDRYPEVAVELFSVHAIDPVAALLDFSSTAGLLVLGARQPGRLRARLLGSTGYALMRTSQCPLAIVHRQPLAASPQLATVAVDRSLSRFNSG